MNFGSNNFSNEQKENVQNVINQYAGKSEDELMTNILRMASAQRVSGQLNDEQLDKFAASAAMMMSPAQKEKLAKVIAALKTGR